MAFLAALGTSGIGTALAVGGQLIQGIAASNAAKANAAVQRQANEDEVRAAEIRNRRKVGSQIALRAASGVTIDDGSPLLALEETLKIQEEDIEAIRRTGRSREAAELNRGKSALIGGFVGAENTLLTRAHFKSRKAGATKIGTNTANPFTGKFNG